MNGMQFYSRVRFIKNYVVRKFEFSSLSVHLGEGDTRTRLLYAAVV